MFHRQFSINYETTNRQLSKQNINSSYHANRSNSLVSHSRLKKPKTHREGSEDKNYNEARNRFTNQDSREDNSFDEIEEEIPPEEMTPIGEKEEEGTVGAKSYSVIYGDRPGFIDNTEIEGRDGDLMSNIIVNIDYVLVPEKTWKLLYSIYGGGPSFERKVIQNNQSLPMIELHPPLIQSLLCSNDGIPIRESQKSIVLSVTNKLSEVLLKLCELYKIVNTSQARLWHKSEEDQNWELFTEMDKPIGDSEIDLSDSIVFMVEIKINR